MSPAQFEAFLARLYVDAHARANFKANPGAAARKAGLSAEQCAAIENLDWIGLELAARSFAKKRRLKRRAWLVQRAENPPLASSFRPLRPITCGTLKCKNPYRPHIP